MVLAAPEVIVRPPEPTADSPLAEWGRELIVAAVDTMAAALPRARDAGDIEGLHDLRVATRRLGAALRIFGPCFAGPAFRRLNGEARQIRRRSGEVRDLDVQSEFLERERSAMRGPDRLAMRYLVTLVGDRRAARRAKLHETLVDLEGEDFGALAREAVRSEAEGTLLPPSFRQAAPPLMLERYQEFYDLLAHVERPEAVAELHALRIAVKRLRYAMEIFAPAYSDRLKKPLTTARRLQERLGDIHDADVRLDLVRAVLQGGLEAGALRDAAPATRDDIVTSLPHLLSREEERRGELYQEFRRRWRELEKDGFVEALLARLQSPDAPA